jgi:cobalt-precorrin-5B (C1)-methyltransferase
MNNRREGYTTGTCAAAAAKAAARLLTGGAGTTHEAVSLPDGTRVTLPIAYARSGPGGAEAAVVKDGGDDPDVTNASMIVVALAPVPGRNILFAAGDGVGTVTKPGLSVAPGEPAINPVPRRMISIAIREVTAQGVSVTVSIPGGRRLAEKTFNPRLGIVGGLSILGTTGIVRPFSLSSVRASLKCALDVTAACGIEAPVLVPGNIGRRAVEGNFRIGGQQLIEVGNEWGFILDSARTYHFEKILVAGHPGKLVKLATGDWDTHSARSARAVTAVASRAEKLLQRSFTDAVTAAGIFSALDAGESATLAASLAVEIRQAVAGRLGGCGAISVAVALTDMQGRIIGTAGELAPWQKETTPS